MTTTEDLMRYGYFPKELPPPFNTESLADALPAISREVQGTPPKKSKCCTYYFPRVGPLRRKLSIPNPLHQIELCKFLSENWSELTNFCLESPISLSMPRIDTGKKRAITADLEKTLPFHRVKHSTGCRYYIYTDILNYYQSIYTHSISWAYHKKKFAKANIRTPGLIGNAIDKLVMHTKDDQTMGIPIGPDSSLLISEIVGSAIDKKLKEELKNVKGFRYYDDFYLYFKNLSDAEVALSKLHSIVSEFELELNSNKTKIDAMPEDLEIEWHSAISRYKIEGSVNAQSEDILRYFNKAFGYSKLFPYERVLKYAVSKTKDTLIQRDNWPIYESLLLQSIMVEPSVLPPATEIFYRYSEEDYPLDKSNIKETIKEIISYHSQFGHSHELAWSLWLSKTLGIDIDKKTSEISSNVEDCVVALIALDLYDEGLIKSKLETGKWESLMNGEELYGESWLLAYEASVKEWLGKGLNHVDEDAFFSVLKDNDVEFYDPTKQIPEIEVGHEEYDDTGHEEYDDTEDEESMSW